MNYVDDNGYGICIENIALLIDQIDRYMDICALFGLQFKNDISILVEPQCRINGNPDYDVQLNTLISHLNTKQNISNIKISESIEYLGQLLTFSDDVIENDK